MCFLANLVKANWNERTGYSLGKSSRKLTVVHERHVLQKRICNAHFKCKVATLILLGYIYIYIFSKTQHQLFQYRRSY